MSRDETSQLQRNINCFETYTRPTIFTSREVFKHGIYLLCGASITLVILKTTLLKSRVNLAWQ